MEVHSFFVFLIEASILCQYFLHMEKGMAIHSSILAWRIHGQRNLAGYSPWGHKESDTTERLTHPHIFFTNPSFSKRWLKIKCCIIKDWANSHQNTSISLGSSSSGFVLEPVCSF